LKYKEVVYTALDWLADRIAEKGEDSDFGVTYIMIHNLITKNTDYVEKGAYLDGDYVMSTEEFAMLNKIKKETEERIEYVKKVGVKEVIHMIRLTRDLSDKLEQQGYLTKDDLHMNAD
jgi:hypothetical protein